MNLPENWTLTTIGKITAPRGVKVKPSQMEGAPFIGLQHVESHTTQLLGTGQTQDVKSLGSYFERGDVLYGRLRPYLNKVHMPKFDGLASGEFIVFRKHQFLDNAFLKFFLSRGEFVSFANSVSTGDRPRVDFEQISGYPIPIPPLSEQHRIVSEIEKHFTRLNASVAALERVRDNLKRYRASVLQAACEGRLVENEAELARAEGRQYESAEESIDRILTKRRALWESQPRGRRKYREPVAPDVSSLPELPEGWRWSGIGECFEVYIGTTPRRNRPEYWNGSINWVSSGEVAFNRIEATSERVTKLGMQDGRLHLHPKGTILLAMIGEGKTRGQAAILDVPACNNQNSAAIRVSQSEICPEYIFYFLWGRYSATRQAGSGNNQPALNKSRVQAIPFPLPPVDEQRRIVTEVERLLSTVHKAEAAVDTSLKRSEQLRQSVLKLAFSGRLFFKTRQMNLHHIY